MPITTTTPTFINATNTTSTSTFTEYYYNVPPNNEWITFAEAIGASPKIIDIEELERIEDQEII